METAPDDAMGEMAASSPTGLAARGRDYGSAARAQDATTLASRAAKSQSGSRRSIAGRCPT
jgi:hypothetical protein